MALRASGRLYPKLIACFLAMVLFAGLTLAGAAWWFAEKYEESAHQRIADNMEAVTGRLSADILSLFDLQGLVAGNVLIQENLRPYSETTVTQQYYYGAIVDLLWQSRLQFNGLIDSVFLYADGERVLYSANEKGMAQSRVFFTQLMAFEQMDAAQWQSLLDGRWMGYRILPPDRYATWHLTDSQPVIPMAYVGSNHGYPNVLVMNLSLEKLLALYETNAVFGQTRFAIYNSQGSFLCGWDTGLEAAQVVAGERSFWQVGAYDGYTVHQPALSVFIVGMTPRAAFAQSTGYFRFAMLSIPLIFGVCGVMLAVVLSRRMYEPFRMVHESIRPYAGQSSRQTELEAIKTGISALANDRQTYLAKSQEHLTHYVSQTLTSLICGHPLDDEMYFTRLMSEEYGYPTTCCRAVDFILDLFSTSSYPSLNEAMKLLAQALDELFQAHFAPIRLHLQGNMYVLIVHDPRGDAAALEVLCAQAAEHVAQWAGPNATLRWGVGSLARSFGELPASFDDANSAVFALDTPSLAPGTTPEDFHYDRREIVSVLSSCDVKLVEATCDEMLQEAKRCHLPYPQAAAVLQDIFAAAVQLRRRLTPNTPVWGATVDPMAVLLLSPGINTAPLISALLPYIPRPIPPKGDEGMERIALRLKSYMDENYAQELSLDILADALGLSAKYCSRVFKQTLGINVTDYLAWVRVEKIKELLLLGLPLDRIAQQVGITNRTTFTRTFRKVEGVTPGEWRRLHQPGPAATEETED